MKKMSLLGLGLLLIATAAFAAGGAETEAADDGFIIGVSNGWVGSEWRTQMVDGVLEASGSYESAGLVSEVIVQSTDVDVQGQINQVRNLISSGADAILINPNAQNPFDNIVREAAAAGVVVVSTDQEMSAPEAVNVVIDQKEWAATSARWLAEALGGQGQIVTINGLAGHPANEARVEGYREVFAAYPGIEILNETNANWDQNLGQQTMNNLLATYPDLDGVWVQDGMAEGALRALVAADRTDIRITGEARVSYLKLWEEADIDTIAVANPPGAMTSALRVAMRLLQGEELDRSQLAGTFGNTLYVPIPVVVTSDNFDEVYEQYRDLPDYYAIDGSISDAEASAFFN